MKINGKKVTGANIEIVVIPRQSGDLVFKAQAVLDYSDFEKLHPRPLPSKKLLPGGVVSENVEDPKYRAAVAKWAESRTHYMVIKSLQATEGLEWETVKFDDPSTWGNYVKELESSGFSEAESARIINCVVNACGLNQEKIDEATNRFLAAQAQMLVEQSSLSSEPNTTPSGEPVNA